MNRCTHVDQIREVTPEANGCVECLAIGDEWVHLRLCMICGHVGCCDSSKGKHATAHARASDHRIVESFEPGEDWFWCYVDEVAFLMGDAPHLSYVPANTEEVRKVI
jgi:Zn-finger in ubiquitin-hydrolases and other protein